MGVVFLSASCGLLLAVWLHHAVVLAICACVLGVQAAVVPVGLRAWVGNRAGAADRPSTYSALQLWFNIGTGLAILGGQRLLTMVGGWQGSFTFFAAIFLVCALLARRMI